MMVLEVSVHKITGQVFVTDLENGNTWSKEDVEKVIKLVEENHLQSQLGDEYIALKEAQKAFKIAEIYFK